MIHLITYLYIAVWGMIWIAGGIAVQVPQWGRWSAIICIGAPLLIIGAVGAALRAKSPLASVSTQMDYAELRIMLLLGLILCAGGLLGALHAWNTYAFNPLELNVHSYREAPWMKWIFVTALVWAAVGGCGMSAVALRAMWRQGG